MKVPIVGIDLGTTNSSVAIVENGRVTVIKDDDSAIVPSMVGITEDGRLLVGQPARNQYVAFPERTVRSIKRKMGTDEIVNLGGKLCSPPEISAIILKRLKQIAENHLHGDVKKAVITVPAYFSDAQRQATRLAGEIAGLEVVRIINEPTAAALAYETGTQQSKNILVYDLGGGTFDVSIVSLQMGVVEVLSSHGNNHLGGDDFDHCIVQYLLEKLRERGVDAENDAKAMARLTRSAENAKIHLSNYPFAVVREEFLTDHNGQPVHLEEELERHEYEALIEDYIHETLDAVHIALEGANLQVQDIDEILLVGGSTRTPMVQERLTSIFSKAPRGEINPDLCVAMGAAIQGATIAGESISSVLVDITPYTFGTSAIDWRESKGYYPYCYVPIIKKNSALPTTRQEVFYTNHDGQLQVEVNIYQGEDPDALNNIRIGQFRVEGLSDVPSGNPVLLELSLDVNGILKVTASEKSTGLKKTVTIDNACSQADNQRTLQEAHEKINLLFGEDGTTEQQEALTGTASAEHKLVVQARALAEKGQRLLESANPDDAEDLINQIEAIQEAIAAGDVAKLELLVGEITDLIYFIER